MQVEKAFDVLKEKAEGEILEAAKVQVAQRTEKLLSAVDVDKFLQGAPQLSSSRMPANAPEAVPANMKFDFVMHSIIQSLGNRQHCKNAFPVAVQGHRSRSV